MQQNTRIFAGVDRDLLLTFGRSNLKLSYRHSGEVSGRA